MAERTLQVVNGLRPYALVRVRCRGEQQRIELVAFLFEDMGRESQRLAGPLFQESNLGEGQPGVAGVRAGGCGWCESLRGRDVPGQERLPHGIAAGSLTRNGPVVRPIGRRRAHVVADQIENEALCAICREWMESRIEEEEITPADKHEARNGDRRNDACRHGHFSMAVEGRAVWARL